MAANKAICAIAAVSFLDWLSYLARELNWSIYRKTKLRRFDFDLKVGKQYRKIWVWWSALRFIPTHNLNWMTIWTTCNVYWQLKSTSHMDFSRAIDCSSASCISIALVVSFGGIWANYDLRRWLIGDSNIPCYPKGFRRDVGFYYNDLKLSRPLFFKLG